MPLGLFCLHQSFWLEKSTDHSGTVTDQATSISHDNAEQQGIYTTKNTTIRTTTDWSKGYIRALIHIIR